MDIQDGSFSILLVQNDIDDLFLFKRSLEANDVLHARVDAAKTIEEATQKLAQRSYQMILAESKIQGESGLQIFEMMQEASIQMPFVLLMSLRDDNLARQAMEVGIADVVVKSENHFHQLAEKLKKVYVDYFKEQKDKEEPQNNNRTQQAGETLKIDDLSSPETLADESMNSPLIKDELTGLFTHSYLHQRMVSEFSRAVRYNYPLSCVMIDIDHFKSVNEKKGYHVGDMLLQECGKLLFDNCRLSDVIARYGGTHFLVLSPCVGYEAALAMAKRLRIKFSEHIFVPGEDISITVSIGVSSFPEDAMITRADMIQYAQRALLHSKATGRNRATLFKSLETPEASPAPKLEVGGDQVASFQRKISKVAENARRDYVEISRDLLKALEDKDSLTAGHGAQCAKYAKQVASVLGLSVEESEVIEHGALLHDIGKICIPDSVLFKTGKLTLQEFEVMKNHTTYGHKILKPIKFLYEEALIARHHHEWFNGKGYPDGLKGEAIPLGARICSVIDAYDTMLSAGQRYKKKITPQQAAQEMVNCAGIQFDPIITKAFLHVLVERREIKSDEYDKEALEQRIQEWEAEKAKVAKGSSNNT